MVNLDEPIHLNSSDQVFGLWKEAGEPRENQCGTGRTCKLHKVRPLAPQGLEPITFREQIDNREQCNIKWQLGTCLRTGRPGCGPSFQTGGVEDVSRDPTPQPPWETLLQENSADSRTSDSVGTMFFSFLAMEQWASGPALDYQRLMEVSLWTWRSYSTCPWWHSSEGFTVPM